MAAQVPRIVSQPGTSVTFAGFAVVSPTLASKSPLTTRLTPSGVALQSERISSDSNVIAVFIGIGLRACSSVKSDGSHGSKANPTDALNGSRRAKRTGDIAGSDAAGVP